MIAGATFSAPTFGADSLDTLGRRSVFTVEAGVIDTKSMEISGYNQGNATKGWSGSGPTYRLEYWDEKKGGWNYGVVYQPLSIHYSSSIKSSLSAKGQTFSVGDSATLDYDFPTLRFSANYPIYKADGGDYLRAGGSAVVRYARVKLTSGTNGFTDTNLLLIPLVNLEAKRNLRGSWNLFTRADFLPSIDGNVFLDGLFDVFLGVKKDMGDGSSVDFGIRSFFGGYDPKKQDDYANRIFFNSLVVRYNW